MPELTSKQKKDFARQLYVSDTAITQAEVAERVGVSKKTICKWVAEGQWDSLRRSLLVEKETRIKSLYQQLEQLDRAINSKEDGKQYANSKEADAMLKITQAIHNLETETNLADKIETGKLFLQFIKQTESLEEAKRISTLFDAFIKSCLR